MEKQIRCAIYTRKSSEEGLEQDFNSLDAQREACTAYVASQRHEGWQALAEHYDDGGFSGGNTERPALQKLFADIRAGKVDTIVVYKIDRLTRSLADFAKMMELFDAHKVNFVAITQQFNTTTSMGRLTLNVLLSFAQFEREVTGERIRDKIAASKAKGMWMGGTVPLGYDRIDRKLVINPTEAELVRHIFKLYLKTASIQQVQEILIGEGHRTKQRGNRLGRPFTQGNLANILTNPLYHGKVTHKGKVYEGLHDVIIPDDLWQQVQARRKEARKIYGARTRAASPSLLAGRIFDAEDRPMSPSHGNRNGKRYQYYVSQAIIQGLRHNPDMITKIPAYEAENVITAQILNWLTSVTWLEKHLQPTSLDQLKEWQSAGKNIADKWPVISAASRNLTVRSLIHQITVNHGRLDIKLSQPSLLALLKDESPTGTPDATTLIKATIPATLTSLGKQKRLIIEGQGTQTGQPNPELIKAVALGHVWHCKLVSGEFISQKALAENLNLAESHVARYVQLGLLAPDIVEAILQGHQPLGLSMAQLYKVSTSDWQAQRRQLGFPA